MLCRQGGHAVTPDSLGGGGGQFCEKLCIARATGARFSKEEWAAALGQSYGDVSVAPAREWKDGAPTDVDKFGTLIATVWPEADYRTDGSYKAYGSALNRGEDEAGRGARAVDVSGWAVDADGDLTIDGVPASQAEWDRFPHTRLLQRATDFLKVKEACVDKNPAVSIRAAGVWAIHVESSKVMLREMGELYVDHDIQYAAATDGGRQLNDKDVMVAAAAALRCDGRVVGRALDPHALARSSYEAELASQSLHPSPVTGAAPLSPSYSFQSASDLPVAGRAHLWAGRVHCTGIEVHSAQDRPRGSDKGRASCVLQVGCRRHKGVALPQRPQVHGLQARGVQQWRRVGVVLHPGARLGLLREEAPLAGCGAVFQVV